MLPLHQLLAELDFEALGQEIYSFAREAYPMGRSLTGNGVRQTLDLLGRDLPLEKHEVPSGTPVFDWTVPEEWNLREGYIADSSGRRIVDSRSHNLHVLGYSEPVSGRFRLAELRPHLYSDPARPDAIPYRTSYYKRRWGFCLPHRQLEALPDDLYEVRIDATLEPGHLTYGEVVIPGEREEIVLLSAHVCHPSLANDNLSGLGVVAAVARQLQQLVAEGGKPRYTYVILFAPGTLGAITWLARNEERARRVAHGLIAANLGDGGAFRYKESRRGDATIDRAVRQVLQDAGEPFEARDFVPFGYDERQFCSPGFDLPVGSLTRTPWGEYPEYHSSDDDLELIRPEHLALSARRYLEVIRVLETEARYLNQNPKCEPQLGRRGLYSLLGGRDDGRERELVLLWVLNLSDGEHSLLDICQRAGQSFGAVAEAVEALVEVDLLRELEA